MAAVTTLRGASYWTLAQYEAEALRRSHRDPTMKCSILVVIAEMSI